MQKILATFTLTILLSVTVCGQLLSPKRIVFEKDTGIFFKSSQEIALLVKLKQLEACETERKLWVLYADSADAQLARERQAYDSLYQDFHQMQSVADDWKLRYNDEYTAHQNTRVQLVTETNRKLTWRKWTARLAAATLVATGTLLYVITH